MRLVPGSERVFGEDADPTLGRVRWSPQKSLWILARWATAADERRVLRHYRDLAEAMAGERP